MSIHPDFIFNCIVGLLIFDFVINKYLGYLNKKSFKEKMPHELNDIFTEEKYNKARSYYIENHKFEALNSTFSLVLMLLMLNVKGFAFVDGFARSFTQNEVLVSLLFFGILGIASDLLNFPFEWYDTFVIEKKYGFNKTTLSTFVLDKIKAYALMLVLGGGLGYLIISIYNQTGENFWWITWLIVSGFSILMAAFYTNLILPIFNKLTPMEENSLKAKIKEYAEKVDFKLDNIFVLDGSKRSTKSNAFFTGFGAVKKIVLYDTLIEQQNENEITAVLAHEVGHYKKKHIQQSIIISVITTGITLYLLAIFLKYPIFSEALGVEKHSFHIGILVFGMLFSPISFLTEIFSSYLSRKNEYEADKYASETYDGEALVSALKKLSVENLSHPTPHPLVVKLSYSHPTVLQRIEAIRG